MSDCQKVTTHKLVSLQILQDTLLQLQAEKGEQTQFDVNTQQEKIKRFIQILEKGQKKSVENAKEPVAKKQRDQELLKKIKPAFSLIADGKVVSPIESKALKELQKFIIKEEGSKARAFDTLTVMSRWIEAGNEAGYWQLCPPPLPVMLKAPASPFGRGAWQKAKVFEQLLQGLKDSFEVQNRLDKEVTANLPFGQFVLSAILLGDIHDRVSLKALMSQLNEPLINQGDHCWLDLRLIKPRQIGVELRRWFPDPMTELLFYRLDKSTFDQASGWLESSRESSVYFRPIRRLLLRMGVDREVIPSGFKGLFRVVEYQRMLESSSLVTAFTSRKFISHSVREDCWTRLMGGLPHKKDEDDSLDKVVSTSKNEALIDKPESPLEPIWFSKFRQRVFGSSEQTIEACANECAVYLNSISRVRSMRYLVPEWIHYILTERRQVKGKLAISTIKGFLSSTGKRLVSVMGDVDIMELDEAGFEDIYWQVLEDVESGSLKRSVAKGLTDFHEFLIRHYDKVPKLTEPQAMGMGRVAVPVDANIISLDEYEDCLTKLLTDRELNNSHEDLAEIAHIIVILGFRCGLRRSEALKLRLADYHPSIRSELLIRPWSNRRLKTKSSTRKIPIHALLTKHELGVLDQWFNQRLEQEKDTDPDELKNAYLFVLPEETMDAIKEDFLFSKIHRVLRAVTQDETLRFHHLRHSFATWTVMRLMLSDLDHIPVIFPQQVKTQKWLEQSKAFRKGLYLNDSMTRKHIYAVSSLLGHSGPDMSLEHYIHCLDLVSMLTRKKRFGAKSAIKVVNFSSTTAYDKKIVDDLDGLLAEARNVAERKKRGTSFANQQAKTTANLSVELIFEKSGYEVLENLYAFLSMCVRNSGQKRLELARRYDYSKEEIDAYIQRLDQWVSQRLHINKDLSVQQILPLRRLNDEDEKEFKHVANAAFSLLKERPVYVAQICDHYSENIWSTRRGLIFKKRGEVGEAKRYISFLKAIGIDEQRIELAFYKGSKSDQIKFWRSSLGLESCVETLGLSPQNINSPGTLNAVRVKVRLLDSKGLPDGSEVPYLRLLMFILGFIG